MDKEIKESILILALENLIYSQESILEDKEITLSEEEKEISDILIKLSMELLLEYLKEDQPMSKPKWKRG